MTTENNLNSYYSHQALKKENDNSLGGPRPCQAVADQPCWGTTAMGCCRWAGTARAASALGDPGTQTERKHPCPAGPARAWEPGLAGREGLQDPSQQLSNNMDTAQDATWAHAATSVVHNKPSPTLLQHGPKKWWLIYFIFF